MDTPHGTPNVPDRLAGLTERQREVLKLIAEGRSNGEIAQTLGISLDGAKWHVREVITRLGTDTRQEAADEWRAANGIRPRLWRMARALTIALPLKWAAGGAAAVVIAGGLGLGIFLARDSHAGAEPETIVMVGNTMEPTLSDGETLTWEPYANGADPIPGDIVVFRDPHRPEDLLIKRVVAPGPASVKIEGGLLFVDNRPQPEPYLAPGWTETREVLVVPEGEYFVMGDNRNNSLDSRSPGVGGIPRDHILGRVVTGSAGP